MLIENPELSVRQLMRTVKGPDFPLGGRIVTNVDELKTIYEEGRGSIKVRGEWKFDVEKKKELLVARAELPVESAPRASPGLDRLHYAPRARLVVAPRQDLVGTVASLQGVGANVLVGLVTRGEPLAIRGVPERSLPEDPAGYAEGLFAALHDLDDAGCHAIALERIPDDAAALPATLRGRDRLAQTFRQQREEALLFRELARLRFDCPLTEGVDDLEWTGAPRQEPQSLCAELGDESVLERIPRFRPDT
jgi:hypothetical protein